MIYPRLPFARVNYFALAGIAIIRWLWTFRLVNFWKMKRIDTSRWKHVSAGTSAPLVIRRQSGFQFSRYERESIHPQPCLLRRDGDVPCAPSLRHPIISHDLIFTTRNTKLAFHLRELQFAASARHLRRPFSLLVHSFPFIPSRVIRFLLAEPAVPVTFQSVLAIPRPYRLYYVFASSLHHLRRWRCIDVAFCPAYRMKSVKGCGESRWKGQCPRVPIT